MPESPLKAALEDPAVKAELAKTDVKDAIERIKASFWKTVEPWTGEQWANAGKALLALMNGLNNIPEDFRKKITGNLEGSFFAAAYGLFIAVWAQFELTVEILIMRQLRLSPQEASIVCGGLSFGSKIHMLLSLLSREEGSADGILLLKQAQEFADRNSFAHGFLYDEVKENPPTGTFGYTASLLKREIKFQYVSKRRPLDIKTMATHVLEFHKRHVAIKAHFGVTDDDAKAYQKSIVDDALTHEAQAERRRQSLTNARITKKKVRGQHLQQSQPKPPGPRQSAKQRRTQALNDKK